MTVSLICFAQTEKKKSLFLYGLITKLFIYIFNTLPFNTKSEYSKWYSYYVVHLISPLEFTLNKVAYLKYALVTPGFQLYI